MKYIYNSKVAGIFLFCALAFSASSCQNIREELEGIREDISNLRTGRISTAREQAENMKITLGELEKTDSKILEMIGDLRSQDALIESSIDGLQSRLSWVKDSLETVFDQHRTTMVGEVELAKVELQAELDAFLSTATAELNIIRALTDTLSAKDSSLRAHSSEMKEYIDGILSSDRDWATSTFMTLDQMKTLSDDIASVSARDKELAHALDTLDAAIDSRLEKAVEAASVAFGREVAEEIAAALEACGADIEQAGKSIKESYTEKIKTATSELEESIKGWIMSELDGYPLLSELKVKLESVKSDYTSMMQANSTLYETRLKYLDSLVKIGIDSNAVNISTLKKSIPELESRYSDNVAKFAQFAEEVNADAAEIRANSLFLSSLSSDIESNMELAEQNESLIAEAEEALSSLNPLAAASGDEMRALMKTVSAQTANILANSTLVASNAKAIALNRELIEKNAQRVKELGESLETAKEELTLSYESIISEAISSANGEIEGMISESLRKVNQTLAIRLNGLDSAIEDLEDQLSTLGREIGEVSGQMDELISEAARVREQIDSLFGMIRSVVLVPSSGAVAGAVADAWACFDIRPSSAASELATLWQSRNEILSLNMIFLSDGIQSSSVESPVAVEAEGGILRLKLPSFADVAEDVSIRASLVISNGCSCIASDYFNVSK